MTRSLHPAERIRLGDPVERAEKLRRLRALQLEREKRRNAEWWGYADDPIGWTSKRLGEFLWSTQRDIAASVAANRRTAVHSCHDAGKSFLASRIASWWLDTHPPGEAFVVTTAPTYQQVRGILWREIGKAHRKGGLPGRVLQTEWKMGGELVAWGRKPSDHNEHAFQGIHARYVLVILDEACGVPANIWTAAETLVTNAECRILAIGNPDDPTSHFAEVCKPGSGWSTIRINGLETPNFTRDAVLHAADRLEAEGQPVKPEVVERLAELTPDREPEDVPTYLRPLLLSPEWVLDKARVWGIDSPLFTAKVLGQFPDLSDDALIPWSWIARAQHRDMAPEPGDVHELGVDVARFGSDRTIIVERHGPKLRVIADYTKQDTMTTAGQVIRHLEDTGADRAKVDAVGVGGGVVDRLREQDVAVAEVQASWKAQDPARFADARSEWYWQLREMFEQDTIDIADDELAAQLGRMKYTVTSKGQIKVLGKEDMKKAGHGSPDRADAATYAIAKAAPTPDVLLI